MANREACELYIDQEIETGLEEGKTPYSIGKDLSDWVAKLFEVRIKPNTLRMRAVRHKEKVCTNVHERLNDTKTTEMIKNTETENKNDGVNLLINRSVEVPENFDTKDNKAVEFYNMHRVLVKIGKSKSQAQSANIISESDDVKNTVESLRTLISKGKKAHNLNNQRKEANDDQEYFRQHEDMIANGISKSINESAKIISEKSGLSQQIMQAKIRRGEILSMPNEKNGDKSMSPLVTIKSTLTRLIKINKYLMDRLEFQFKKKIPNEYINNIKDEVNLLKIILIQIEGENNEED